MLLLGSVGGAGSSISGTWRGERGAGPGTLRRSVFSPGRAGQGGPWSPSCSSCSSQSQLPGWAHRASSAPLERRPCSSKRRRTLLLSASARRYGWLRRSAGSRASAGPGHTHGHLSTAPQTRQGPLEATQSSSGGTGAARTTRPGGRLILVGPRECHRGTGNGSSLGL